MLVSRASNSVSQTAWLIAAHVMLVLCGCSVYDSDALQGGINTLNAGSRGNTDNPLITASTPSNSDASADLGPDEVGTRKRGPGDSDDAGMQVAKCGDGQVTGIEKCDTAIADGEAGACPKECPALERCVPRVRNGTGCQTECVLRQLTCESGDGCCPGNCTKDNDLDCSSRCGDGIVQTTSGETCEPETDKPCLSSAAACEDEDACTIDRLTGSSSNCNVACVHEPITTAGPDDGCCPNGANSRNDPNCMVRCGNNVKEDGEDCDGSEDCDPSCKFINAEERLRCTEQSRNDCERCACEKCTATELACRANANPVENRLCRDIVDCSQQNKCIGNTCYCGDSLGCALPNGPCRMQIEQAGGTPLQVAQQLGDPNTPVGRSYAADMCRVSQCAAQCR